MLRQWLKWVQAACVLSLHTAWTLMVSSGRFTQQRKTLEYPLNGWVYGSRIRSGHEPITVACPADPACRSCLGPDYWQPVPSLTAVQCSFSRTQSLLLCGISDIGLCFLLLKLCKALDVYLNKACSAVEIISVLHDASPYQTDTHSSACLSVCLSVKEAGHVTCN